VDEFLTVAEVAELLRLNQQTVRNWIDRGSLPALRVGRRVRIRREDLQALLDRSVTPAATDKPVFDAQAFWSGEELPPLAQDAQRRRNARRRASRRPTPPLIRSRALPYQAEHHMPGRCSRWSRAAFRGHSAMRRPKRPRPRFCPAAGNAPCHPPHPPLRQSNEDGHRGCREMGTHRARPRANRLDCAPRLTSASHSTDETQCRRSPTSRAAGHHRRNPGVDHQSDRSVRPPVASTAARPRCDHVAAATRQLLLGRKAHLTSAAPGDVRLPAGG